MPTIKSCFWGNEKNPCSEEQGRIYRGTTLVTALLPSLEIVNADLRRNILFYSTAEPVSFEETRETEKTASILCC